MADNTTSSNIAGSLAKSQIANTTRARDFQKRRLAAHEAAGAGGSHQAKTTRDNLAINNAQLDDPAMLLKGKERDLIQGARFGEAVLGEDGLGRSTDNPDIVQGLETLREEAKGYSGAESLARREKAIGGLNQNTQDSQRRLQAQLARSGVRGAAAGAQIRDTAVAGMQQRGNLERDLFLDSENAKRQGTQNLLAASSEQSRFDLGQRAKEKNIIMQGGFGFAQMGAAERGAVMQAQATQQAGAAQAAAACHIAGTLVQMANGDFKKIEEIKVGEILSGGGRVKIIGQAEADDDIYELNGEFTTGSHVFYDGNKYINVIEMGGVKTNLPKDTIVYPLLTEFGYYTTINGGISGDLLTEEQQEGISFVTERVKLSGAIR